MFKQSIVWLRLHSSSLKGLCLALLLLLSFNLQVAHGSGAPTRRYHLPSIPSLEQQPSQPKITAQATALGARAPGQPVERELAGGQNHSFQIDLATGQYVRVKIDQRGIDLVLQVLGPDGKPFADYD